LKKFSGYAYLYRTIGEEMYMNVKDAIEARRAYRSLKHREITDGLIADLAESAARCCLGKI
jgi:hypothetical protein